MQNKKQVQAPAKNQKTLNKTYLFLVALYFLLASAQVVNILVRLTAGSNAGTFFEFINPSIDRTIVYALNCVTILYITVKSRRILSVFLLFAYLLGSYLLFMQILDTVTMLLSFVVLAWFLTNPKPFSTMCRKKAVSLVTVYLIMILVITEISALICWFIFPFAPHLSQEGACRYLVELETKMFVLTGSLAPVFTVLFLFSWITKSFFSRCSILRRIRIILTQCNGNSKNVYSKRAVHFVLLACSITFSFLVVLYPFLPGLNPNTGPIGVDFKYYDRWLAKTANEDIFSSVSILFFEHPDRPLTLLALYLVKCVSGIPASTVIQFVPLVLAPALILAVYFFMRETKTLNYTSLLAAFLAVSSFQITVQLYSFSLANWMAIIELYLLMGFYFSAMMKKSYGRMGVAMALSIVLLFTHSGAWEMSTGVLLTYLLLTVVYHKKNLTAIRFETSFLIILVLVNVAVFIARNHAAGLPAGSLTTLRIAQDTVSVGALESFGHDVSYTFFHTMYGFFVNPLALFLALLGSFIIVTRDTPTNRYLTAWLLGSCTFFVLASGWEIKSRILFNLPLPVFEAVGLVGITSMVKKIFEPDKTLIINRLTILFIVLAGLNYAFRCAFEMPLLA